MELLRLLTVPLIGMWARVPYLEVAHTFVAEKIAPIVLLMAVVLFLIVMVAAIFSGIRNLGPRMKYYLRAALGTAMLALVLNILGIYTLLLVLVYFGLQLALKTT